MKFHGKPFYIFLCWILCCFVQMRCFFCYIYILFVGLCLTWVWTESSEISYIPKGLLYTKTSTAYSRKRYNTHWRMFFCIQMINVSLLIVTVTATATPAAAAVGAAAFPDNGLFVSQTVQRGGVVVFIIHFCPCNCAMHSVEDASAIDWSRKVLFEQNSVWCSHFIKAKRFSFFLSTFSLALSLSLRSLK